MSLNRFSSISSYWMFVLLTSLLCCNTATAQVDSASYVVGTGDRLAIEVFDEVDLTGAYLVEQDGTITFPFIGRLSAAGKTLAELQQTIYNGLIGDYLINPRISVSINSYRQFFVNGEVKTPGGYPYESNLTVQKAIALAGGLTEYASAKKIYIQREGQTEDQRVKVGLDAIVRPGDIISIKESFF